MYPKYPVSAILPHIKYPLVSWYPWHSRARCRTPRGSRRAHSQKTEGIISASTCSVHVPASHRMLSESSPSPTTTYRPSRPFLSCSSGYRPHVQTSAPSKQKSQHSRSLSLGSYSRTHPQGCVFCVFFHFAVFTDSIPRPTPSSFCPCPLITHEYTLTYRATRVCDGTA